MPVYKFDDKFEIKIYTIEEKQQIMINKSPITIQLENLKSIFSQNLMEHFISYDLEDEQSSWLKIKLEYQWIFSPDQLR